MAQDGEAARNVGSSVVWEDANYTFNRGGPKRKRAIAQERWAGLVDTLNSEHGYIFSLLESLEEQSERLRPGKVPDYPLLLEIVDYLVHYPGEFHHPREDLLFAALLRKDRSFKPLLDRLSREHTTLKSYGDKLYDELNAIVAGGRAHRVQLRESIGNFISGYRKHMEYESREIFPRAGVQLTPSQLKRIEARTRFIDDPLFGREVRRQYRRLGRNLQLTLGRFGETLVEKELAGIEPAIEAIDRLVNRFTELRDSVNIPAGTFWREQFRERKSRSREGPAPSWQARVLNLCTRTTMKPMMRFGSVESMRGLLRRLDSQGQRLLPEDVRGQMVRKKNYQGEWVRLAGKRARKTILYFPGGGFIMRTPTQHKALVARICRAANARALLVHYSLAPEVPFPGGLEDCLAAYHDLLKSGCKPADITIAGDSAGGGLVLSTLLALRDEGSPLPAGAIVLSPLADLTYSGGSREFNKCRDPMLPTHRASKMHQLYIGEALPEDRFISPIFADFDGLPPILGLVGSTEILLDDTVRAAARAKQAGVDFYLEIWEEMPHVFPIFGVLPESKLAIERMAEFIDKGELEPLPERYGSSEIRPGL